VRRYREGLRGDIEVVHANTLAAISSWHAESPPHVGETIRFTGKRTDTWTVVRVEWGVYIAYEAASERVATQIEAVRVFVE
jgi:hypothetical protein